MADWIASIAESLGYWGIGLLMFLENIFPPIPSEMVMPSSGFAAQQGSLSLAGVVAAGSLGSILGLIPWYFLGRLLGEKRVRRFTERYGKWLAIRVDELDRAVAWFRRHGRIAVLVCRLVPGIRTLVSIPAGIAKMPFWQFLAYSSAGAIAWTFLLAWLGWLLRESNKVVADYVSWIAAAILVGCFLWWAIRLARQRMTSDSFLRT